jgi:UDP-3-O-[3-hydroxymyristoyl] glucosamine N-acyltransferase
MTAKIVMFFKFFNFKTIYFNLRYLPFRQALKLPVLISKKVYLKEAKGVIEILGPIYTGKIKIGYGDMGIFDRSRSRTIWEVSGTVTFEGSAFIGQGSKISVGTTGVLRFGNNFTITAETAIVANSMTIKFGNSCLISWDNLIMDTDFHNIYDQEGKLLNQPKDIVIGNDVWIGCRCLILKGTIIPDNCIVAASSVVSGTKLHKSNCIYGGQPLKVIKENVSWKL